MYLFILELNKLCLKHRWNNTWPRIVKILLKKYSLGELLSDTKICRKVMMAETVWCSPTH